ncbi:MAG: hypothetical protein ACJ0G8_05655 [Dehalococcoidia bacterium]
MRLRRLIGSAPEKVMIGNFFEIDSDNSAVYAIVDGKREIVEKMFKE